MLNLKERYFNKYPDRINEYEELKSRFKKGESLSSLCKDSIFERHMLSNLLKAENVTIKPNGQKYNYNEKAFKKINSEENAYWLGFMYADGNINELRNVCDLTMAEKDLSHMKKFQQFVCPNKPLIKRPSRHSNSSKIFYSYRMCITNKIITNNLVNMKCQWSKTYDVVFPTELIPKKYIRHFIRGLFDGDGCICGNKKPFNLNFCCANEKFLFEIQKILNNAIGLPINKIYLDKRSSAKFIQWSSKNDLIKFYNYIYKNSNIYLDRKFNKFTQVIAVLRQKSQKS